MQVPVCHRWKVLIAEKRLPEVPWITGLRSDAAGSVGIVYRITKAPLTIITKGATKVYDGEPLTEAKMTIKGLKNNEEVGHKTTGSQTEVGSSENSYTLDWKDVDSKNYNLKKNLGTLKVTALTNKIPNW